VHPISYARDSGQSGHAKRQRSAGGFSQVWAG
jgi:hypothetical protein